MFLSLKLVNCLNGVLIMKLFVSEICKHYTIINGQACIFHAKEYGLTISFKRDCLPPSIKECQLIISADLYTDIPLPHGSLLTSGVYHITTMPVINQLNQAVEICMEHCAKDIKNLYFVVAKEDGEQQFEHVEGGTFEIDASGRKIGRIYVSNFSSWAIVTYVTKVLGWFKKQDIVTYCGRVYYDDRGLNRIVHFVITRNLLLAREVSHIHCAQKFDISICSLVFDVYYLSASQLFN